MAVIAGSPEQSPTAQATDMAGGSFRVAKVARGDLLASVGAAGTIEPEETVDVGAQVAGQIKEIGLDKDGKPITYGSVVEAAWSWPRSTTRRAPPMWPRRPPR